ncbi:MAG TPA: hypothetical protein VF058_09185 [Actinomycetota bacterium]
MAELTRRRATSPWREGWGRTIGIGVVAGIVASAIMGVFAMIAAATYQDIGFFTPLHHIATPLVGDDAMMASMEAAARGELFELDVGPALVGLGVHMMVGAVWGLLFFGLARAIGLRGAAVLVPAGIAFGLLVMLFMSWVTLPITAEVVGGGEAVEDIPSMVGWGTFTVEHVLFGFVLGTWAAARRSAMARHAADREEPRLAA